MKAKQSGLFGRSFIAGLVVVATGLFPASNRLHADHLPCLVCLYDQLGGYCAGAVAGAWSACAERWDLNQGFSGCRTQGGGCGTYQVKHVRPDGSVLDRFNVARLGGRWSELTTDETVLRDCSGAIVDREMTAKRADALRRATAELTI